MIATCQDIDVYQATMMAFCYQFEDVYVTMAFKCRNDVDLRFIKDRVVEEIKAYVNRIFTQNDFDAFNAKTFGKLEHMRIYIGKKLPIEFDQFTIGDDNNLTIRFKASAWTAPLVEIATLQIINEVFNEMKYSASERTRFMNEGDRRLTEKIKLLNQNPRVRIMEFGTRRRFSKDWQEHVLTRLVSETKNIIGTSNIKLSEKLNIPAKGTMGHYVFQVYQGITHPLDSQSFLLRDWREFWGDKFLIALSDIFPNEKFLKDFNRLEASTYVGARQDSMDPVLWGEALINHYHKLDIDPLAKTAVFSNSLNIPECIYLEKTLGHKINTDFGVGTDLTNDMGSDHIVLNIVMKIVKVNDRDVAKLANDKGKGMCENPLYSAWLTDAIDQELKNA